MMINPQTILIRTQAGAALLQTAGSDLSRTERLLLIMVNGQVSVGDISGKLYSIPLRRLIEALDYLSGRGLISHDHTNIPTATALKRHELEAFLRTDELDPTTAMIANFELQAALNDSAYATITANKAQESNESSLDSKIQAKIQSAKLANETTSAKQEKPVLASTNTPQLESVPQKQTPKLVTEPLKPLSRKRTEKDQKKQSPTPFILLFIFAILWFGVVWYVRHR